MSKEIVVPNYNAICNNAMLISEWLPVYKYENQKRTGEILGYKADFVISKGESMGTKFTLKMAVLDEPTFEMMTNYAIDFNEEKSTVYVNNNSIQVSLWANEIQEEII